MRLAFAPLHNSWATNHHFQKHRTLDIMGSKDLAAAFRDGFSFTVRKELMSVRQSDLTPSDWLEEAVRALVAKHQITNSSFRLQPHFLQLLHRVIC